MDELAREASGEASVSKMAAMTGTDVATYTRGRPGMSAFALEVGIVYPHLFHLRSWTGRPLGHVSVARPHTQKGGTDGHLVAPPRRVQQGLSQRLRTAPAR